MWCLNFFFSRYFKYRMLAFKTRGLYTFYPLFEDHFFVFKDFFWKILSLCMVSIQERVMMARVWYLHFTIFSSKCLIFGWKYLYVSCNIFPFCHTAKIKMTSVDFYIWYTFGWLPFGCTVLKSNNLQCNTLGRWVNRAIVSLTKHLKFQVLFFFIITCKILCKTPLIFFYNFTKIEIKSFECPKSKPATHCFIFNLSK